MHDSREGISIYRTGTPAGSTGPTSILLKGVKKSDHCTPEFLIKNGAASGSDIYMTENAYMADIAWNAMSESHCKGVRAMPYITANPEWWVLEIFVGYGSHINNLYALEVREKHRIIAVKEEADSSHLINKEGFSPAVLQKLRTEFKIEPKDWTNVLTCYNVCKNKPEYLGREAPSRELFEKANKLPDEVKASLAQTKGINHGLSCFNWTGKYKLDPNNTPRTNEKILDHMCGFRNMLSPPDKNNEVAPSPYLVIAVLEDNDQRDIFQKDQKQILMQAIISKVGKKDGMRLGK
jgi:hypothetical protein